MADAEKYTRLINLMLGQVGTPIDKCDATVNRIYSLMNIAPVNFAGPDNQDDLVAVTLNKVDRLSKALEYIDDNLDRFLAQAPVNKHIQGLSEDAKYMLATGGGGRGVNPKRQTIARPLDDPIIAQPISRSDLDSMLDNITASSLPTDKSTDPAHMARMDARASILHKHRGFFYEDKEYIGADGERKVMRVPAMHDITASKDDEDLIDELMDPALKKPTKIDYDAFTIHDVKSGKTGGYLYSDKLNTIQDILTYGPQAPKQEKAPQPRPKHEPRQIVVPPVAAQPAPGPGPRPAPAAVPVAMPAPSGDDEDDPDKLVMPKWTKGPPSTSEEIDEYKAFMKARYEMEQRINAAVLAKKKRTGG